MESNNDRLLGQLLANQKALLNTVAKLEAKIDAQAAEIAELKTTISNLKAGGRALLWVAGLMGTIIGVVSNWAWKIYLANNP